MPYGLVNASSAFQDFMHEVLQDFLHKFVLVYIHDILVYSRSIAEHRQHVAEVLQCLTDFNLFLKAETCSFHWSSVPFLGYIISENGNQMDEGKVKVVREWPLPTSKELQRFLGFTNYRRFIKYFSSIIPQLTSQLKGKPKSLSWTPAGIQAFKKLRDLYHRSVHLDPSRSFVVEFDASTSGVGAVLS